MSIWSCGPVVRFKPAAPARRPPGLQPRPAYGQCLGGPCECTMGRSDIVGVAMLAMLRNALVLVVTLAVVALDAGALPGEAVAQSNAPGVAQAMPHRPALLLPQVSGHLHARRQRQLQRLVPGLLAVPRRCRCLPARRRGVRGLPQAVEPVHVGELQGPLAGEGAAVASATKAVWDGAAQQLEFPSGYDAAREREARSEKCEEQCPIRRPS